MPAPKRPRACDACHALKIKCELGSVGGSPPCQRCVRLGKDCAVTPPKKQKDRVAELEAQVASLTKLLAVQQIQTPDQLQSEASSTHDGSDVVSAVATQTGTSTKKRKLNSPLSSDRENGADNAGCALSISEIDLIVPQQLQATLVAKYLNTMPFYLAPVVNDCSYDRLREKHAALLGAILYAASPGILSDDAQEELASAVLDGVSAAVTDQTQRSLELVQALQIIAIWYRTPRRHTLMAVFQYIQLAIKMAEDIGIGAPEPIPSVALNQAGQGIHSVAAWRAWIVCYLLSANMSLFLRQQNTMVWGLYEDSTHFMLEYWHNGPKRDRMLGHIVRGERLCELIADRLGAYDYGTVADLSDPEVQQKLRGLQNLVTDWKVQISPSISSELLDIWEHTASLLIHECVLHTLTNKQSFSAPYIAERLSATDYPSPATVTPEQIKSLGILRDSCHNLIDLFAQFATESLVDIPATLFTAKVVYAQWILVKLYITLSGSESTYGLYVDFSSLGIHDYLQKLINTADRVKQVDAKCGTARILTSATRISEWLSSFEQQQLKTPVEFSNGIDSSRANYDLMAEQMANFDWPLFASNGDMTLDLDEIFATALHPRLDTHQPAG